MILFYFLLMSSIVSAQNPEWVNYTNGDHILSIAEEGDVIWIGTNGGLVRIDRITENVFFYNKGNSGLPDLVVRSIAIDSEGNKWIGTFTGGLIRYDGDNWTIYNTLNSDLPDNFVYAITVDAEGNKWTSWRQIFPPLFAYAERYEPKAPFEYMHITWTYKPLDGDKTELSWDMNFELLEKHKPNEDKWIEGMGEHTESNQAKMKEYIESQWPA